MKGWDLKEKWGALGWVLSVTGLLMLLAGCHGRGGKSTNGPLKPGELADAGRAEIVEECGKQTYELAKKGLIVSETGLHEDVFVLRDRVTFGAMGYSLDEALRLESELLAEATGGKHPTDQSACIADFADHLESLSDPLVEADARRKELDASAFTDAAKEAEKQAEKKLEKPEDAAIPLPEQKDY